MLKKYLEAFAKAFPVEWDRYTQRDSSYDIYGWIARKDGKRDFVLLQLDVVGETINAGFVTSSAKYSKEISEFMFGARNEHSSCKKVAQLMQAHDTL